MTNHEPLFQRVGDKTVRRLRHLGRNFGTMLLVILCVALIALYFIPLPYYVYAPGSAEVLAPLITVKGGHKTERGSFMLTTVLVVYADNVYDLLYGLMLPHSQLLPESQVDPGFTNRQYDAIERYMMASSHEDAVIAALQFLHKPIQVKTYGVQVIYVEPDSKADRLLRAGDVITALNGTSLRNPNVLLSLLSHMKPGQVVHLKVLRGVQQVSMRVPLIRLPGIKGSQTARAGIGFIPAAATHISTPISIRISTGDINGPSAGFMFTLEVINQLYGHGDLTRGYRIAGTGTIDASGNIGQIGGAAHKVVAAAAAHAQIFFVPADQHVGDTNALHAEQEAAKLHTSMRVVPVKTLRQAVAFLLSLKEYAK